MGRLRTVTVAVITSTIQGLVTEVPVGPDNGLGHASAVNLDNVFTIDHRALGRRIGFLLDQQESRRAPCTGPSSMPSTSTT